MVSQSISTANTTAVSETTSTAPSAGCQVEHPSTLKPVNAPSSASSTTESSVNGSATTTTTGNSNDGAANGPPQQQQQQQQQIFIGRPAGVIPLGVREDTTHHASLFIGDLSPEVNDATLRAAFAAFASLSECRVMYDPNTGRSRGYGFASFGDETDARKALSTLNGEWLGSRPLRINWANQKTTHHRRPPGNNNVNSNVNSPGSHYGGNAPAMRMPDGSYGVGQNVAGNANNNNLYDLSGMSLHQAPQPIMTYEQVSASSPPHNTTVYIGNLHPMTTQEDVAALFSNISFVREVRIQSERGYGFAVLDSHEAATTAICQLGTAAGGPGIQLHGRVLRLSWGRDRNDGAIVFARGVGAAGPYQQQQQQHQMQMGYGPQGNAAGVVGGAASNASAGPPGTSPTVTATPTTSTPSANTGAAQGANGFAGGMPGMFGNPANMVWGVQPHIAYGAGFALPSTGYGPVTNTGGPYDGSNGTDNSATVGAGNNAAFGGSSPGPNKMGNGSNAQQGTPALGGNGSQMYATAAPFGYGFGGHPSYWQNAPQQQQAEAQQGSAGGGGSTDAINLTGGSSGGAAASSGGFVGPSPGSWW